MSNPKVTDVHDWLKGLGYRWCDSYISSEGKLSSYKLKAKEPELASYLPMDRICRALGVGTTQSFSGFYLVHLTEDKKPSCYYFCYYFQASFHIEEYPVELFVSVAGDLSGPFPSGVPLGHNIYSEIAVGPIPMGRGQRKLALNVAKEAVRAAEAFVAEFPDATVWALLETRGGRGGWKQKVARMLLGSAQKLAQEEAGYGSIRA